MQPKGEGSGGSFQYVPDRGRKRQSHAPSQWRSMTGQEAKAQTEIQEISCKHNGNSLLL